MLHILLLVLKIIGVIILCILGVVIFAVVCALFVPVRYRMEALRREGEGEPPVIVKAKITWLLHFVNVLVRFDGGLSVRARLMLFTFFRRPGRERDGEAVKRKGHKRRKSGKEEKKESAAEAEGPKREDDQPKGTPDAETAVESRREEELTKEKRNDEEKKTEKETVSEKEAENHKKKNDSMDQEADEKPGEKPSLWDKLCAVPKILCGILKKIKDIFENIQYTIQKFCDKIRAISDNIKYYRDILESELFKSSFELCKGELLTVVRSLKPQRFEGELVVGMDDPAATGQILAVCGILYPLLGAHVNVAGDFEKKRLEGRVYIKGKLTLFTFLRTAVRLYFNKDIRKLYGLLKKEAV